MGKAVIMNRAFYIVAIPAFIVSFLWMYYAWGLMVAAPVIVCEFAGAISGVIYLKKRQTHARSGEQASTGSSSS